ncbi:hypothetical protein D1872_267660 [compost metagenome]
MIFGNIHNLLNEFGNIHSGRYFFIHLRIHKVDRDKGRLILRELYAQLMLDLLQCLETQIELLFVELLNLPQEGIFYLYPLLITFHGKVNVICQRYIDILIQVPVLITLGVTDNSFHDLNQL